MTFFCLGRLVGFVAKVFSTKAGRTVMSLRFEPQRRAACYILMDLPTKSPAVLKCTVLGMLYGEEVHD